MIEQCQGPNPNPELPRLKAPLGSTDSHFHILGPAERFPYVEGREYTPLDALPAACRHLFDTLGVTRAVLIQPSVYGADNSCMIEAATQLAIPARMIVVIPFETTDKELVRLHDAGARGVRFILAHQGGLPLSDLERFSARIKEMGWHIELLLRPNHLLELESRLAKLPTDFTIDHLGFVRPEEGLSQPAFQAMLRLITAGRCWVKFTGGYRLASTEAPFPDLIPFAEALVTARPDRILWGSDWPHVMVKGKIPNTTELFDLLLKWVPDEQARKKILVDNPAQLFGF